MSDWHKPRQWDLIPQNDQLKILLLNKFLRKSGSSVEFDKLPDAADVLGNLALINAEQVLDSSLPRIFLQNGDILVFGTSHLRSNEYDGRLFFSYHAIDGQWYCGLLNYGHYLPEDKIKGLEILEIADIKLVAGDVNRFAQLLLSVDETTIDKQRTADIIPFSPSEFEMIRYFLKDHFSITSADKSIEQYAREVPPLLVELDSAESLDDVSRILFKKDLLLQNFGRDASAVEKLMKIIILYLTVLAGDDLKPGYEDFYTLSYEDVLDSILNKLKDIGVVDKKSFLEGEYILKIDLNLDIPKIISVKVENFEIERENLKKIIAALVEKGYIKQIYDNVYTSITEDENPSIIDLELLNRIDDDLFRATITFMVEIGIIFEIPNTDRYRVPEKATMKIASLI